MKTFKILSMAAIALFLIGFTACEKESIESDMAETGSFFISMTDAPADYASLDVSIASVSVFNAETGKWVVVNGDAQTVNILELRNGKEAVIASNSSIDAGLYTMLKINIGEENKIGVNAENVLLTEVFTSTNEFDLTFENESDHEIIIEIDQQVSADSEAQVLLDFDAANSVIEKDDGSFSLSPEITALGSSSTVIEGNVATDDEVVVYITNGTEVRSTYPDENGNYMFKGVFEGEYELTIKGSTESGEEETLYQEEGVEVSAEATVSVNATI